VGVKGVAKGRWAVGSCSTVRTCSPACSAQRRTSTPSPCRHRTSSRTGRRTSQPETLSFWFAQRDPARSGVGSTIYNLDERLARIRDIRASEKRFYQKVRDLFAATSADYTPGDPAAKTFFATIQNKLIHAVTGRTAGELVLDRSDAAHPTMGLSTWKGDRPHKADVGVAKNYLTEVEVTALNRLTTMFLDFAEDRAQRRQQTLMADWAVQADRFLEFNERAVLAGAGSVSASQVERIVEGRYVDYDARQRALESERASSDELRDLDELVRAERRLEKGDPRGDR